MAAASILGANSTPRVSEAFSAARRPSSVSPTSSASSEDDSLEGVSPRKMSRSPCLNAAIVASVASALKRENCRDGLVRDQAFRTRALRVSFHDAAALTDKSSDSNQAGLSPSEASTVERVLTVIKKVQRTVLIRRTREQPQEASSSMEKESGRAEKKETLPSHAPRSRSTTPETTSLSNSSRPFFSVRHSLRRPATAPAYQQAAAAQQVPIHALNDRAASSTDCQEDGTAEQKTRAAAPSLGSTFSRPLTSHRTPSQPTLTRPHSFPPASRQPSHSTTGSPVPSSRIQQQLLRDRLSGASRSSQRPDSKRASGEAGSLTGQISVLRATGPNRVVGSGLRSSGVAPSALPFLLAAPSGTPATVTASPVSDRRPKRLPSAFIPSLAALAHAQSTLLGVLEGVQRANVQVKGFDKEQERQLREKIQGIIKTLNELDRALGVPQATSEPLTAASASST